MTSLPATFEIEPLPDGTGFRLAGELDLATAPELGAVLSGAQLADGLVLEVGEVTFVDSTGFRVLCGHVRENDRGRLTLLNATPALIRALELMGLEKHPRIEIR